jgi:hypothetical protein
VIFITATFTVVAIATFVLFSTVSITSHAIVFTSYTASGFNNTFVTTSTAVLSAARACACTKAGA